MLSYNNDNNDFVDRLKRIVYKIEFLSFFYASHDIFTRSDVFTS